MKLVSQRPNTSIEFDALPELSSVSFRITAMLDGRKVSYGDIALLKTEEFLAQVKRVLESGTGEATLEGTYDFRLTVRPISGQRSAVSFYLAEFIAMPEKPDKDFMRLALQGSFSLSSDVTGSLLSDFETMLAAR